MRFSDSRDSIHHLLELATLDSNQQIFDSFVHNIAHQPILDNLEEEVSTRGHQVIVEVVVARVQSLHWLARFHGAQKEEASRLFFEEERKVF